MSGPPQHMTEDIHPEIRHHRHAHRKRMARIYLIGIFALLSSAHALLFWFCVSHHNPWRMMVGLMVGEVISTTLLLAGIWKRLPWARYVLSTLIFGVIAFFSLQALYLSGRPEVG